jgi:UDP-glucuronate 4-epimerase
MRDDRQAAMQGRAGPISGPTSGNRVEKCEFAERDAVATVFAKQRVAHVVHLAARADVAYSSKNPAAYIDSNLVGFANFLVGCRHAKCQHLVYASSSSVYGANETMPLRISHWVDEPLSLSGAAKRANELIAYAYARLYGLPATGLRFYRLRTVGPSRHGALVVVVSRKAHSVDDPERHGGARA